jgi:hypothetical protein
MFAELAAIASTLSAINGAISTLRETKANATDAAKLLGKFSDTATKLDRWEKKTKLKRPLTTKEAMDLSIQRRKIKQVERDIKDVCLMAGCADVWRDAQRIRAQSELDHAEYMRNIAVKRKIRRAKVRNWMIVFLLFFLCGMLSVTGWGVKQVWDKWKQLEMMERYEEMKNMRKCGRKRC